jgi:predicted benzoate:H+ symporter BenE
MIDIAAARIVALRTRLPASVKGLLVALALISSAVIGYAMGMQRRRSSVPVVIFSLIVSATIYTVLDLDSPRYGLIRLDAIQQALQDLHDEIK